jgi:hypothetical protein
MQGQLGLEVYDARVGSLQIGITLAGPAMFVHMANVHVSVRPLPEGSTGATRLLQRCAPRDGGAGGQPPEQAAGSAPASATGILPAMQERVAAIAAAVDQLLNSVGVRVDRLRLHLALPHSTAADGESAAPSAGTAMAADQNTPCACVTCRVRCLKVVDASDWSAHGGAADAGVCARLPQVEKTVSWDGAIVAISQSCACAAPLTADAPTTADDEFHECEEPTTSSAAAGGASDEAPATQAGSSSIVVLSGADGQGWCCKAAISLVLTPSGAPRELSVKVTSPTGILVPLTAATLSDVSAVAVRAHALVRRMTAQSEQQRSVPLTESVLESLRPVEGLREVAAVAAEECSRCAPFGRLARLCVTLKHNATGATREVSPSWMLPTIALRKLPEHSASGSSGHLSLSILHRH